MKFKENHLKQIQEHNLTKEKVMEQLQIFVSGLPKIDLAAPATLERGIYAFTEVEKNTLISNYENVYNSLEILKFVPASGAATRMFKALFQFLDMYDVSKESVNAYINKYGDDNLRLFFVGLEKFPFYNEIQERLRGVCPNFDIHADDENKVCIVETLLGSNGLNYGNLPKGLVPFHKYKEHAATAFEEHLFEASKYAAPRQKAKLHFTISKDHYHNFKAEYDRIKEIVKEKTGTEFTTTESYQKPSTDTIAVNLDNTPFLDNEDNLVFRPGGHGALIENLNEQDADVIFIKNIDNVVTFQLEDEVATYKKMLAGLLLKLRDKSYYYLNLLDSAIKPSEETLHEIVYFLQDEFNNILSSDFEKFSKKYQISYLREQLNKPIRVCGMVKNEGEPGGGPFWVKHESGAVSLQIVESAQINMANERQRKILEASTHFNPVDIVCSVRNYKGEKFNLLEFVDAKAGFINKKSIDGKDIKALELPGLWNGAMAYWNTVFVEVPLITFNPVKTVTDLLKPAHQVI